MVGQGVPAVSRQPMTAQSPIGIVCGGGQFPAAVAESVLGRGRQIFLLLLEGFADPALTRYPHAWLSAGKLGAVVPIARRNGCKDLVMIGSFVRPRLSQLIRDWRMLLLLPRLARLYIGGDNRLLSGVGGILEAEGFRILGAHEVAPEILFPEGTPTRRKPSAGDLDDIRFGLELLRATGAFDLGQAAAIAGRRVLAIEAAEGTSEMLARIAQMRSSGRLKLPQRAGILVKAPKPGQDRRIDLPAIGLNSVAEAKAAGLVGIAVEADSTIVADSETLIEAADAADLFITAMLPIERAEP